MFLNLSYLILENEYHEETLEERRKKSEDAPSAENKIMWITLSFVPTCGSSCIWTNTTGSLSRFRSALEKGTVLLRFLIAEKHNDPFRILIATVIS